jgi:glycosyltransferase involved in cell wall biosynthesis
MMNLRPLCLDLSRTVSRVGLPALTGIDRVERAYLDRFLAEPDRNVLGLVRVRGGHVLLDRAGLVRLQHALDAPPPDRGLGRTRRRVLWQLLRGRFMPRSLLARSLRRRMPSDGCYVNVGHTNLSARMFGALAGARCRSAVLLHDVIPLTHPQFQRVEIPGRFDAMLRRTGAQADLVIATSRQAAAEVRQALHRLGRVPEICTVPLGVVTPQPPDGGELPTGVDPTRPLFTCIGTIEPRKNHRLLLDVWEELQREVPASDLPQLAVVGRRGWADPALFARLDRTGGGRAIHEFNDLPDGRVARLLQASAALVFPSHAEGFGLPAAEAAALGVPVICSQLPVFREILGSYPTCIAADDPAGWVRAIRGRAQDWLEGDRSLRTPIMVPSWTDHFNIVLSRL